MRVIKPNTLTYESFNKSLPYLTKSNGPGGSQRFINLDLGKEEDKSINKSLKLILEFKVSIAKSKTNDQIFSLFEDTVKRILNIKELNIFIPDYESNLLISVFPALSERMSFFINKLFENKILKEVIYIGNPKIIVDSLVYNIDGTKTSYLLIPLGNESLDINGHNSNEGILVLSLASGCSETSPEILLIQLALAFILAQISFVNKQVDLKNKIDELQTYQSKLANDFKLSAIGELTSGIVEEILSPLQVITSTTELLRTEDNQVDGEVIDTINQQVKKVKSIINNLLKFAGNNDAKSKVQPCNINELIKEFYELTYSSLNNDKYECITDLEENLPPVITQPNSIYQLLTNILSIIRAGKGNEGGILIQTKYRDEKVEIRFLTTDMDEKLKQENLKNNKDMNLRIINNIMSNHEGDLFIDSDNTNGTVIILSFPLKRNLG
ncbi:MAG: histidine kinase dimerization/phospho-acceptor domain-containing protein [Ignavibacteriaceae bacterium]